MFTRQSSVSTVRSPRARRWFLSTEMPSAPTDELQNQNAPVGRYAAFAYTAALNRLLSDSNHCRRMGDTTVVFWAEDAEPQYQDFFGLAIDGGNVVTDDDLRSCDERAGAGEGLRLECSAAASG